MDRYIVADARDRYLMSSSGRYPTHGVPDARRRHPTSSLAGR